MPVRSDASRAEGYLRLTRALALVAALLCGPALEARAQGGLTFDSVPIPDDYAEAADPEALRWACAKDQFTLVREFAASGAPFDPALVRRRRGRVCHIDYAPTLPGFRAHPDDLPISELVVSVENLALVSRRERVIGDALDISAQVVEALTRPVPIVLTVDGQVAPRWYELGVASRYGNRANLVSFRTTATPTLNPWTQDFLKSGAVGQQPRMLVPRRLFEGRADDGEVFAPLLDAFRPDEGFVRSRLSWEGGDLQFVNHPRDPSRLVLFHGRSAKGYWGEALTDGEYAYVLRREFGADLSIDIAGLTPHVDYFVSFLPASRIALVAEPVADRLPIARAAVGLLVENFAGRTLPRAVDALRRALESDQPLSQRREAMRRLIAAAREESNAGWPAAGNPVLYHRVETYVFDHCPTDPSACFNAAGIERLLQTDIALLRDWLTESRRSQSHDLFTSRLVDIIESQVEPLDPQRMRRIAAKVAEIEALGFSVVRVPRFGSDQNDSTSWAGLGYANSLLVDEVLYLPMFGLGQVEADIVTSLEAALPAAYRIVPVFAQHMLLHSGGVHCTVAIVRRPTVAKPAFRPTALD